MKKTNDLHPRKLLENPPQYEETCPIASRYFSVSHVGFQGWKPWISCWILGTESQLGKPGPFFSTYWTLHRPSEGMSLTQWTRLLVGGFNPPKKMRNFRRMSCNQEEFSDQNWNPFFAHVLPFRLCRVTWNSAIFVPQKLGFEPKLFGLDASKMEGSWNIEGNIILLMVQKSGKLTSWYIRSVSQYLQRFFTSQVVQEFLHQQYDHYISLISKMCLETLR